MTEVFSHFKFNFDKLPQYVYNIVYLWKEDKKTD